MIQLCDGLQLVKSGNLERKKEREREIGYDFGISRMRHLVITNNLTT